MAYPNKNNGFLFLWTIPVSLFLLAKPRDGVRTNMADPRENVGELEAQTDLAPDNSWRLEVGVGMETRGQSSAAASTQREHGAWGN